MKIGMDNMFDDEPKARCPDCNQSLTFVRTKAHEKRWYCYGCEKYVDQLPEVPHIKESHARLEALTGLQVVDSHGILVGRVRKAIPTDAGDIKSLLLSVDKEQFKTLLEDRDISREFEVSHEKIATVGDVVILADVFSPSSLAPPPKPAETVARGAGWCRKCGAQLISGAKHCIKCGTLLDSAVCASCGSTNPTEAMFCKNCGNRLS
ncbi:MAG TPA: zinc-ribbon domain-containing protein [Candidatus Dormibacteraeota bacterium]|nr:zinc-ribbon domain-containing protein [Candidatus Dormibacteraeota bacterium]